MSEQHINSQRVKHAFGHSATTYDQHAVLQREAADRLLAHLEYTKIKPQRVLDVGCGTGYFTRLLRQRFSRAYVTAVDIAPPMLAVARREQPRRMPWSAKTVFAAADACALPFADASFDLVASNLVMQCVGEPQQMLAEMRRVLAPGGLLLFSTFGRRTLRELRQSLADFSHEYAGLVLPFPDVTSLGDALMKLPVELPVTDSDLFTLTYADAMALIRELKGLGASSSAIRNRPSGLYGRRLLKHVSKVYAAAHSDADGRICATFEVLYAQAWYAEAPRSYDQVIPIEVSGGA
ncbi:MAG: malonyl-ACP O-methyltransferase BioC [Mariprofundaceae bacterium]|nr:malonyl-ACP O-methyltransferase BioC [Mariprofundaceae bacterium]